jgi:FKBP-type peptidyl-prolyl cis-trans isomerase
MHWTINKRYHLAAVLLGVTLFFLAGCARRDSKADLAPVEFTPYTIEDSSRIRAYPDGLQLYIVKQGPGDYPQNGENVRLHYYGVLADGTVFDESYSRDEPLEFTIGSGKVIAGLESAAKKLRFGTKAIAFVPPALGYGDGKSTKLPPKIPANARLTLHLDMVGSF